jgi:hypothetical protein
VWSFQLASLSQLIHEITDFRGSEIGKADRPHAIGLAIETTLGEGLENGPPFLPAHGTADDRIPRGSLALAEGISVDGDW